MNNRPQHYPLSGNSLLQLLISLAITAILVGLSVPSFQRLLVELQLQTHYQVLLSAVLLARSEAISRRQRVSLCQSDQQRQCDKRKTWHTGWIIFVDSNRNNRRDTGEPLIGTQQALASTTLHFNRRTRIAFHPTGIAVGGSNGTFIFCDPRDPNAGKGMILSNIGRIRPATDAQIIAKGGCPA